MKVIVIGAGPAGMMAALTAAERGAGVILLEKNEKPGKKLFISGKGRCNLTNTAQGEAFLGQVVKNPRFLYSSFSRFDNNETMAFFEKAGLPLKTERGGRVFPGSDKSSDVIRTLEKKLEKAGVLLKLNTRVISLITENGSVKGLTALQNGKTIRLSSDRVIIATGGVSYPATGSTGDGYLWAGETGHGLISPLPSLVPFNASFSEKADKQIKPADLMGLSLKNVSLKARAGKKILFDEQGEMLFTHFGISGPLVLRCSAVIAEKAARGKEAPELTIDLKPALSHEQLEARLERETAGADKKQLSTLLAGYVPRAMIPLLLAEAGLKGDKRASSLAKAEKEALIRCLKGLPMRLLGLRDFNEAIVTRGGVSVKDIDPKTMESKRIRGLYFAGEIIDLDAFTGGYNLQIAWTTGRAAGWHAGEEEKIMIKTSEKRQNRHIAIDGPGSSGKSTIAKMVAAEAGLVYVDTGAMFRGMAVYFLRKGLKAEEEAAIVKAADEANVSIVYENGAQQILLNGENVTALLRTEEVGQMASASSVYGPVREKMKSLQQKLASEKDVVMDGRDIGTVILPDAYLKIFMTASAEIRAKRRFDELKAKGVPADYETVLKELKERDYRDTHREIAPLKQADDAVLLDTSDMTPEEVKDAVLKLYYGEK